MTDFLLELRSEEIPARMQVKAKEDLARLFNDALTKAGLSAASVEVFATPRRLALIATGLPLATEAVSEETKGPKVGAPPQAMEGFLRKAGLSQDQLVERDGVYYAVVEKAGRQTADVLAEAIPAIIRAFPWPKSQRWGAASVSTESLRWVRPLQGIVALLGDAVVHCEIDGIVSGAETMGHRFHHSGAITIGNAGDYIEKLRAAHVLVHFSERCRIIRDGAKAAAQAAGLTLVEDEGLVIENAGLTEWPVPMLGRFDAAFLDVPQEVIQLTARVNQKYFVCHDSTGKLANAFVCTANIDAHDGGAAIVAGNEKVLAARLSDAKFFWEQDLKVALDSQAQKLAQITFHEKLGSVADKVERVAKLARWLAEEGIVKGATADAAERAARLCKADLVTGMVGEFPELQGIMGGYYARAQGESDAVADAIRDHYKPVGQGDDVPNAPVTVAVSLADKLDTLAQFFAAGMPPTGSKDPFALRRAAIGFLSLLLQNDLRCSLKEMLVASGACASFDTLEEFLIDRLKVQQREAGVRHDLIDAVFSLGGEDDLVRLLARVKALQAYVTTAEGANLLAAYKRAANILKQAEGVDAGAPAPADLVTEELALRTALDAAEPKAAAALSIEDFEGAMAALATLRAPIDAFFEGVMVNDPDPAKRAFRLGLLARFRDAVTQVADFSKIEG
ncbi:glycine--tRNA ligase subunit beta [Sphingorhabdus wooponensis]|uniref:Glycine--tRNA ligase beta subunit n=1 Tax=Sphingorhabdus wooponensis TaxID=940136 RepID=A0A426RUF3_9SPHN|nr:glycine--tRNA ligase subunit beta [Sphingorhabdus wooponensis]RRQ52598.1 glycine--tRNA ligase subunit beta [Sphingorhabdus wooponensis]